MIPAIIDIEASGFGRHSYPIEIGVVMANGARHCYLVLPEASWTFWDKSAEAVHGISRQLLQEQGQPVGQVGRLLNRLLAGTTVYTDAWSYDTSWLGKLYDAANLPQLFRLESLRKLLSEEQAALWHPTKDQVMQETKLERHRASVDALILQETWKRLCLPVDDATSQHQTLC
jgi:hypothetical protein